MALGRRNKSASANEYWLRNDHPRPNDAHAAFKREYPAHSPRKVLYSENWEDMEGYSADIYLDVTDVFPDYLKLLKTHALMRERYSSFRYYDFYEALGTTRGALGGFMNAVTLMHSHSMYHFERQAGLLAE